MGLSAERTGLFLLQEAGGWASPSRPFLFVPLPFIHSEVAKLQALHTPGGVRGVGSCIPGLREWCGLGCGVKSQANPFSLHTQWISQGSPKKQSQ